MASQLTALSPLDGRYAKSADPLRPFFSEHALIRYRVRVELAWLMALAAEPAIGELKPFSRRTVASLNDLVAKFNETDGLSDDEKSYGPSPALSDDDKRALIEFIKTF